MPSVKMRLEALQSFHDRCAAGETIFIVDGGKEFRTRLDPWDYLRKYGTYTPTGERIVLYPHPAAGIDPLSLSLYELLDEAVERGEIDIFTELERNEL